MELRSKDKEGREHEKRMLEMAKKEGMTKERAEDFMGSLGYEGYKQKGFWGKFKDRLF